MKKDATPIEDCATMCVWFSYVHHRPFCPPVVSSPSISVLARKINEAKVVDFFECSDWVCSLCSDDVAACSDDAGDVFPPVFGVHLGKRFAFVAPMCLCILPSFVGFVVKQVAILSGL